MKGSNLCPESPAGPHPCPFPGALEAVGTCNRPMAPLCHHQEHTKVGSQPALLCWVWGDPVAHWHPNLQPIVLLPALCGCIDPSATVTSGWLE